MVRALGIASVIVLPLVARGRTFGRLTFISSDPRRRFGPEDVTFAQELARRAASALVRPGVRLSEARPARRTDPRRCTHRFGSKELRNTYIIAAGSPAMAIN